MTDILREQLFVRRFDAAPFSSEELFHLIEQNVTVAHYLVHGAYVPSQNVDRAQRGHRIRLVIDDLRVLASLCPGIQEDSSFLSHLRFWLEREGVTPLFALTDSLKPYKRATNPITELLQPLLNHTILTWGVGFEGRNRIAISVLPASRPELNGVVRELELPPVSERTKETWAYPKVNRYFELYTGVEEEHPRRVPLAIYLFRSGPGAEAYIQREEIMYRQRFLPAGGGDILRGLTAREYFAWRDYTHLTIDAQSEHTTLFEVDGYWSLDPQHGTLASQAEYLGLSSEGLGEQGLDEDPDSDHFKFFEDLTEKVDLKGKVFRRRDYFENSQYKCRAPEKDDSGRMPDRVPFMWDFGFMLVNASFWRAARLQEIELNWTQWPKHWPGGLKDAKNQPLTAEVIQSRQKEDPELKGHPTVEDIRLSLREIRSKAEGQKQAKGTSVPWRFFLGALQRVTAHARMHLGKEVTAFDYASTTPEGLNALFLEIWFSEMMLGDDEEWKLSVSMLSRSTYTKGEKFSLPDLLMKGMSKPKSAEPQPVEGDEVRGPLRAKFDEVKDFWTKAKKNKKNRKKDFRLTELPPGVLCLYRAWLLLLDVMNYESLFDQGVTSELRTPKKSDPGAMAVRHSYVTACEAETGVAEPGPRDAQIPFRMPGHFSMRDDTFLAMTEHSRSRLLGDYALDLLSSRRANLTRLQFGMGLPVRDVIEPAACDRLPTALVCRIPAKKGVVPTAKGPIKYGEFCSFGGEFADHLTDKQLKTSEMPPLWLFRAGIKDYDRISRPLNKWLISLSQWTIARKRGIGAGLKNGLREYDSIMSSDGDLVFEGDVTPQFFDLCDLLVAELRAAERK